jgi:hypothetical protein
MKQQINLDQIKGQGLTVKYGEVGSFTIPANKVINWVLQQFTEAKRKEASLN